jgi:hypothetical protein
MIVRDKSKLMIYVGNDPTGKAGILKKAIGNFTQEELRGWHSVNPISVSQHVIYTPEKKTYEPNKEDDSSSTKQG